MQKNLFLIQYRLPSHNTSSFPLPSPHSFPSNLQEHDNRRHSRADRRLGSKTSFRPDLSHPSHLEVRHDEPSRGAREVDPGPDLAALRRVRIELVRADAHTHDHGAEHVHAPRDRGDHVMPPPLQRETQDHEAGQQEWQREIDDR